MWKVYAGLALIAALGGAYGVHWVNSLRAENARLQEANTALQTAYETSEKLRKREATAAENLRKRVAELTKQKEASRAALSTAQAKNPEWAGTTVPADVLSAIGL